MVRGSLARSHQHSLEKVAQSRIGKWLELFHRLGEITIVIMIIASRCGSILNLIVIAQKECLIAVTI